jgi:hypothetical protein
MGAVPTQGPMRLGRHGYTVATPPRLPPEVDGDSSAG